MHGTMIGVGWQMLGSGVLTLPHLAGDVVSTPGHANVRQPSAGAACLWPDVFAQLCYEIGRCKDPDAGVG